ncbi:MAG: hypothetical protein AAGF12_38530 [Myxococcota bacterium]
MFWAVDRISVRHDDAIQQLVVQGSTFTLLDEELEARLAALSVQRQAPDGVEVEVLRRLPDRTTAEAVLTLDLLTPHPPSPEEQEALHRLAEDRSIDPRVQDRAIRALGHPESSDALMSVLASASANASLASKRERGVAIANCGSRCRPLVHAWLEDPSRRTEGLRALSMSPTSSITPSERAEVEKAQSSGTAEERYIAARILSR